MWRRGKVERKSVEEKAQGFVMAVEGGRGILHV